MAERKALGRLEGGEQPSSRCLARLGGSWYARAVEEPEKRGVGG